MKTTISLTVRLFSLPLLVVAMFGLAVNPASAITRNQLTIANLDTSKYPNISFYFWAFDGNGEFVKNITTSEAHIIENSAVLAANSLEMLEPGVRFITVINEGPTLANRYSMVPRIDHIKEALLKWAQEQPATSMDDFSLVNNQGAIAYNQADPTEWVTTINGYTPDLKKATPGLAGLSTAIDQAFTSGGATRKTPAILYITPMPDDGQMTGLKDLFSRAESADIRLFIWLIGPTDYAVTDKADVLRQAAIQTNGEFFLFSGSEQLPELSSYLSPLRYVYKAIYTSQIKTSGNQSLSLQVRRQNVVLDSNPMAFALSVAAPNPIFLSPPEAITLSWVSTGKRNEYVLEPKTTEISYLLEFPDGLPRDLKYARLFVDGKLAAENTSAPFDVFTWDISQVQQSGSFQLQMKIQDSVGFQAETIQVPVDIVVGEKPLTWYQRLTQRLNLLTIIPILMVTGAGVLLILIGGKTVRRNIKKKSLRTHRLQDPVTQPVEIEGETMIRPARVEMVDSWPRIPGYGLAPARLLLSSGKPEIQEKHEIPIGEYGITLGSDATKAKVLLNYPLVSPLHARIFMDDEKQFHVADEGSTAGTWLNYAPVSKNGAHLEHGDVIQFGKATFRFEQVGVEKKKFTVIPLDGEK